MVASPLEDASARVLVVDDEPINLQVIEDFLDGSDYKITTAADGEIAWHLLEQTPEQFDIILLDRMMPNMDGMEVLRRVKAHPILKAIPVVLQTARAGSQDIIEGIQAGALHYLTKPFEEGMLLSVLKTTLSERRVYQSLRAEIERNTDIFKFMQSGEFAFSSLDEGRNLASLLAHTCPSPETVVIGLSELMTNAVEHGNLGITYEEKTALVDADNWLTEVERRLALPENADKRVQVSFERRRDRVCMTITDQGQGFDWQSFLVMDPDRAMDNHGRGIAMAGLMSFLSITYHGTGNSVTVEILLPCSNQLAQAA